MVQADVEVKGETARAFSKEEPSPQNAPEGNNSDLGCKDQDLEFF